MLAGIIFLLAGLMGIGILAAIWKGHLNLIAGYNTMSKEKQDKVDKKKLRAYVLRILAPIVLLLIETGIVFIIKLKGPIAIAVAVAIPVIVFFGLFLYGLSIKFNKRAIDIAHIFFTTVVTISAPVLISVFTFVI